MDNNSILISEAVKKARMTGIKVSPDVAKRILDYVCEFEPDLELRFVTKKGKIIITEHVNLIP